MTHPYIVTIHALRRAVDMAIEAADICELMAHPEIRRWDQAGDNKGGWLYVRGDLAAIVDEYPDHKNVVRTFLPATRAGWEREAALPMPAGRDTRYLNTQ